MLGHNIRLANPNEFPSVVTILRNRNSNIVLNRDVVCGGVLISKQDVLTSEHCIINESISGIIITAGSNNIFQASRFYPSWWITYDQWCTQINKPIKHVWNDIAIIRLTTKVGNAIPIATISSVSPDQLIGLQVDAVGWGTMNNGSIALELQTASVNVLNRYECSQLLSALASETIPIEKRQLCTIADPYVLVHEVLCFVYKEFKSLSFVNYMSLKLRKDSFCLQ
ncbi:PREDICTED: trypsin iota-like [Ceratosolen solmsi marchali]|uniref:Trypsin iota-like n=1 Tax=Ceratosolen solmsi marchali TaxID=326594 RepID=A0AAJ7DY33_9HYME|nr:PREDICTED: trypsin iota-like [Ceratosolen solmsi marchali]